MNKLPLEKQVQVISALVEGNSIREAVENAFENDIDYGMLVKVYGSPEEKSSRYSPLAEIPLLSRHLL